MELNWLSPYRKQHALGTPALMSGVKSHVMQQSSRWLGTEVKCQMNEVQRKYCCLKKHLALRTRQKSEGNWNVNDLGAVIKRGSHSHKLVKRFTVLILISLVCVPRTAMFFSLGLFVILRGFTKYRSVVCWSHRHVCINKFHGTEI